MNCRVLWSRWSYISEPTYRSESHSITLLVNLTAMVIFRLPLVFTASCVCAPQRCRRPFDSSRISVTPLLPNRRHLFASAPPTATITGNLASYGNAHWKWHLTFHEESTTSHFQLQVRGASVTTAAHPIDFLTNNGQMFNFHVTGYFRVSGTVASHCYPSERLEIGLRLSRFVSRRNCNQTSRFASQSYRIAFQWIIYRYPDKCNGTSSEAVWIISRRNWNHIAMGANEISW